MKRVLIVDDEKSFLLSLRDGLKVHRDLFEVLTAENGREAVAILRTHAIDLLVTDLKLPEMNGFELLAWVSRKQPQLPVIVMTAFGTAEIESRLARMDALQYLEKPLDLEMLQEGILNGLKGGTKSYIRGITLATFLQLMRAEQKNCTLKVSAGQSLGYLYVRRGELIDAEHAELQGEAAALEIVAWDNAEIEMDGVCRRQQDVISLSMEHILIEAFRRKDELAYQVKNGQRVSAETVVSLTHPVPPKTPALSAEQLLRKRLQQQLTQLPAVQEYAIFDEKSFLAAKNSGNCSIAKFDPALFCHLTQQLAGQLGLNTLSYLSFSTESRYRYLLFCYQHYRVLTRLKPGSSSDQVIKDIRHHVDR